MIVFAIVALCTVAGIALYFGIIRPFVRPLTERIPHDRKYWATVAPTLPVRPIRRSFLF